MVDISNEFFQFKVPGESTWTVPTIVAEKSDSINFSTSWSTVNVQGSTEAMSAFEYTGNPTIPISLTFHEDLWREFNITSHTYEETISKLASLMYPGESNGTISAPYVILYFKGFIFRGYFTSMRVTTYGPMRNGHNVMCDISAQFTVVKSSSPSRSGVRDSFKTTFQ